jgi:WD40 repeat protein
MGGDAGELLERIVERARERAPKPVFVACGLGGGGSSLVTALRDAAKGEDGSIVDLVAASGIGPSPPFSPEEAGADWTVVLVRDNTDGSHPLASFGGPGAEEELFRELLSRACAVSPGEAGALVDRLGCPTALVPELAAIHGDVGTVAVGNLARACWSLPSMLQMRELMSGTEGRALLDLGRTLCLMDPIEMELSDEWALLASALTARTYAVSDISLALHAFPGLFELIRGKRRILVRPPSRLACELLLGGIPPSPSEHYAIYRALRKRALAALARKDDSDRFVARQLPRQASAAEALPALASDPLGILSSDPFALLRELESEPRELRQPAGKMIALSAHRLLHGPDQASQLELSARRIGLHGFADALAAEMPARRWKPLWAQAELAHTHRVAFEHRSPLLEVAALAHPIGRAFAGSADGEVWRISPYRRPVRLKGSTSLDGEIRAIAARVVGGKPFVAVGTSTHAVGVLDGATGELEWLDTHTHRDPLSAAAIHPGEPGVLLFAGVGGAIFKHPLLDGEGRGTVLYQHGSEVRDIRIVRAADTDLVVFCAVDGVVSIVRLADGAPVARWHMAREVLNSVAAVVDGNKLRLVVGTSQGGVRQLQIDLATLASGGANGSRRNESWDILSSHPLAVNSVRIVRDQDDFAVLSGSSDGSWQWNDSSGTRQRALGHVGPIWSIDCIVTDDHRYVVTAGGEGACRLWLTEAVLDERIASSQPLAHRGPVSAIELAADPADEILVITGGSDGDVRAAAPSLTEGGELLTRHDSEISALLTVSLDEARSHVISGSVDGTLRLTSVDAWNQRKSTVLGIAHEGVTALSIGSLGTRPELVSGGRDGTITSWDLDARTPTRTMQGCRYGSVQALCHIDGHDDGMLVVGGQDGGLSLFRAATLERRGEASMLEAAVLCLCPLFGSGSGLLAGLADGRVAVVRELGLYGQSITYVTASENEIRGLGTLILGGRLFMACAGLDRHLRLLDIQTGEQTIDIELDGYALSLKALGAAVGIGTSAGAAVISYPTDIIGLHP